MKRNVLVAATMSCAIAAIVIAQQRTTSPAPKIVDASAVRVKRDITQTPPVAERAALRLLKEANKSGNAVLFVEFGAERAPRVVTIELERGKATLRDDGTAPDEKAGDGVHTGWITVSIDELKKMQDQGLRAKELPVFVGREQIAVVRPKVIDAKIERFEQIDRVPNRANLSDLRIKKAIPQELRIPQIADARFIPVFPFLVNPADVNKDASLMITNTNVINDPTRTFNPCTNTGNPNGNWTFNHLMSEMADGAGIPRADFVRKWLRKWELDQNVNDFIVPNRNAGITTVIANWPKVAGKLDLAKSPFKLIAIVNRVDLRGNTVYGGGSAGEGRFIFALTNTSCAPQPFLVIFEYGIRKPSCPATKAWGKQWFDLKNHPIGSVAYNNALEAITLQFTEAGTNPAQLPNQSSLNQLRTNEIALTSPWELREFRLSSTSGQLFEDTVKQTPDITLNNTQTLADYANANAALIVQDKHVVPDDFAGNPFLGGAAPVASPSMFWDGPGAHPSAAIVGPPQANLRHHLSLNTCNSCHGGETQTTFTHVSATGALSGFLTGIDVNDPAGEGVVRHFDDLLRRQQSLAQLVNQPCFMVLFFDPLRMEH
ncbi:MAG TPA: choice-of-anchor X domain-containing protein [Thermoanaerobaculia bacterium]